ncbi:MAG: serine hydrolase domain-containing protein [Alphaproteobacteria bacterium]
MAYVPPAPSTWERADPKAAGFDPGALAAAVDFAIASETEWPLDLADATARGVFEPPPWNEALGPFKHRGHVNGLILKGGRIVAEWGTTERVDMTFSITKSYVSTCAGLAHDDGLLPDLDEPVRERVPDPAFDTPHNAAITWRHLLQQTSEWEGELWDKPDLVDRNRDLTTEGANPNKGQARPLQTPGTHWEYNDVRVNLASYAIMRLVGRPLPELLRERIMDPIGASGSWEWNGYRNSWVEVGGRRMQSVSGGGHWGGGLFISSRDHARFGLLMLNRGRWGDRQLISERWIEHAVTPCAICPEYGFMWWLNTPGDRFHAGTAKSFFGSGAGGNVLWICPEHDLVAVCRWLHKPAVNEWIAMVRRAIV